MQKGLVLQGLAASDKGGGLAGDEGCWGRSAKRRAACVRRAERWGWGCRESVDRLPILTSIAIVERALVDYSAPSGRAVGLSMRAHSGDAIAGFFGRRV